MKKAFTLTIFLFLSSPAIADQITLKNGDRLTGKIVKSDGSKLLVQTELIGEVSVDLSAVNSITSDQPLYGFLDLEHNGLQDLTLRLVPGGGIGYHAIRDERTKLDPMGGFAWNREYFKGDNDRSSAEAQAGQTLEHQFSSRVSLKEQLFFFPNLTRGGEYRINFDSSLVMDVTRRIGWQLTLSDRYLSNPPLGFEKNDLLLTTGLKIKLGELK